MPENSLSPETEKLPTTAQKGYFVAESKKNKTKHSTALWKTVEAQARAGKHSGLEFIPLKGGMRVGGGESNVLS